jgi:uncharacterized protein (TIGR02118 family)
LLSVHDREVSMIKSTALYGHPTDPAAFERYYADVHMPLVRKMSRVRRAEAAKVTGTPDGSPPAFYRIFEFWFDTPEDMQAAFGSPEGKAVMADVPNFAIGGITLLISQID